MGKNNLPQLFIGLTSVSNYTNINTETDDFQNDIINTTFSEFRKTLIESIDGFDNANQLYKPVSFNAFGFFNLITFSFIDDFHFGNFSFRPHNQYVGENGDKSNFQFQVVNGYNLISLFDKSTNDVLNTFDSSPFLSVCKIKINSALLIGNEKNQRKKVLNLIKFELEEFGFNEVLLSESFSWHEFTLLIASDSLSNILKCTKKLRKIDLDSIHNDNCLLENSFLKKGYDNLSELNLIVDTETYFGINPKLFDESSQEFFNSNKNNLNDEEIKISTKLQVKTGHLEDFFRIFKDDDELKKLIRDDYNFTNGRSDLKIYYKEPQLLSFIQFWRQITFKKNIKKSILGHTRKIHSNVGLSIPLDSSGKTNSTEFHKNLFNTLKFSHDEIRKIEENLRATRISKEISNSVVTLYTNFNDIICDINLYVYYLDLRSLLEALDAYLVKFSFFDVNKSDNLEYYRTKNVTTAILEFINTFKIAYSNRFLDSKKYGYNMDSKGEFNGGAHQIISAYDTFYKILYREIRETYQLSDTSHPIQPVSAYGDYVDGIKSKIHNLHINYFQLFQPEFFLFITIKEALNFTANGELEIRGVSLDNIHENLSRMIHSEHLIKKKKLIYQFLPPDKSELTILYLFEYYSYSSILKLDFKTFSFWFFGTFIQNSTVYNVNGSLRIDLFSRLFMVYSIIIKRQYTYHFDIIYDKEKFSEIAPYPILIHYLFGNPDLSTKCKSLLEYLFKDDNDYFDDIRNMLDSIDEHFREEKNPKSKKLKNILELINNNLSLIREEIVSDCSSNNKFMSLNYVRNNDGKGMSYNELNKSNDSEIKYFPAVFDPHGGIFTINYKLRKSIMSTRLTIIDRIRDISYCEKNIYYENLIDTFKKKKKTRNS